MKNKKIIAVALSLIVLLAGITVFAGCQMNKNEPTETSSNSQTETTTEPENVMLPEEVTWNGDKFEGDGDGKLLNILLIGQDRRPDEGRQRSDCMILCSLNTETNELSMISFLLPVLHQQLHYQQDRRVQS